MDQLEQDKIKKQLLELRRSVMQEVSDAYAASQELGLDGVPDIGDVAANTYSRDVLLNLSEGQRQKLRDIDAALDRLANGEYGICARCEEEIDPRRLQVRPFSRYCIECKSDIEKFGE